ncbi:MAG: response regulator [Gammaproteobacteria bacterium]|nr:response regulator [Gammaproteobacteria bacterium]MDH5727893.1 response regulator [Gammaproteobacteria bacterium]
MAKVLIVDDEESIRGFVKQVVEMQGHEAKEAENGRIAADLYENFQADLVITDLIMPEMDGLELIVHVKKKYPSVKIIAMSGRAALDTRHYLEFANRFGANKILEKPVDMDTLINTIAEVLAA